MTRIAERTGLKTASEYQIKIFEAVENVVKDIVNGRRPNSLIIEAKPGSGKTTTGVAATHLIPPDIATIFVAFNKKIVNELSLRLPPKVPARTFHSQWLRQWSRHIWKKYKTKAEINHFKVQNAVERYFKLNQYRYKEQTEFLKKIREQADDVIFLVDKAKTYGVVPKDYRLAQSAGDFQDDQYFWSYVMEYYDYQIDPKQLDQTLDIAREILCEGLDKETEIDFDDMLYLPAVKQVYSEKFRIVMIDEAQDLNGLQRYLLSRMIDSGGMIMAIGDSRQSCYAFRGADAESMERIKYEFACVEYPLSISYRCAQLIVAEAYEVYPEIEAAPNAPMGSVERPKNWMLDDFKPGHLIICRNNKPTVSLAYRLIRNRIPAKVLGRDIGQGLIKLIKKCGEESNDLGDMMQKLRAWRDHQLVLIDRKNPNDERSKEQIYDKYACINELASGDEILDVKQLLALVDQMFTTHADEKEGISSSRVTLSTIHKIKGGEADTVFLLDSHLINPAWIKTEAQRVQERNLLFIALTRAKTRLVFVNSDSIKKS